MRINGVASGASAIVGRRRASHGFHLPEDARSPESGTVGIAAAETVALLAAPQAPGPARPAPGLDRQLDAALDDLALLQRALLGEAVGPSVLEQMAKHAEDLSAHRPGLGDVAAAIGLRIRVELARRQMMVAAKTTKG